MFQSANAYKNLRKYLVDDGLLYAVISLPSGVFNPYAGVKTSILLIDKTFAKARDEILFVKINNDGYDLGAQRREIKQNDIPEAIRIIKDYLGGKDISDQLLVTLAKKSVVAAQDYILVGERYRISTAVRSKWHMETIHNLIVSIKYPEKILNSTFVSTGKYPIIDQSEKYIAGYTDDELKLFRIKKPVVCFGDHTRAIKYVDFDFALGADGVKILQPIDEILTKYFYYILRSIKIENLGYSRHFKLLKDIKVPLPPLNIQEEIVAEIEGYQKIIDGARQVVDNYKPSVKVDPKWETVKLGDVCELNPKKTEVRDIPADTNVSFVPMADVSECDMLFIPKETKIISEVYTGYTYFKEDDVLLAKVTPCFENGKSGIARNLHNKIGFGSSEFFVLRADIYRILPEIIYYTISSNTFIKHGKSNMVGTGGLQRVIKDFIFNYPVPLPPLDIQCEIVARMNEEMVIVEQNKRLIDIFEQKIKDKISEVWGE